MNQNLPFKVGQCEICDTDNVRVQFFHKLWVCDTCYKSEYEASQTLNQVVVQSRDIDNRIQLKQDIFNAQTIALIPELRAAIENDPDIPVDQKEYMFAKESSIRWKKLQKVIFEDRQALRMKENEMSAWQNATQTSVGRLRAELRAQFKEFDVTYQPVVKKSIKSAATGGARKKSTKFTASDFQELKNAAKKYDVSYEDIRGIVLSRKVSADMAGRMMAEILGKPLPK